MLPTAKYSMIVADHELNQYFHNSADALIDETSILTGVVQNLTISGQDISNKNIIRGLIKKLEREQDIVTADIIRNTLEIVVSFTSDDI
ncbi:MAG: two-component-system connector protein AriR [Yokenella regensburgei]|nr:two-component-system connector protein AriR [Yokenella regensburgei]